MIKSYFHNPVKIYRVWVITLIIGAFIIIPILSFGHAGGEQKPLIYFSKLIGIAVYGSFALSIITSFQSKTWIRKYWYINLSIFIITACLIVFQIKNRENPDYIFDFSQEVKFVGNDTLLIQREFYSNTDKIRSIKFYLNRKKDSTWNTYDSAGHLIQSEKYHWDRPIKRLK